MKNISAHSCLHLTNQMRFLFLCLAISSPFAALKAQQTTLAFQFETQLLNIQNTLALAPLESDFAARLTAPLIELPNPEGIIQSFRVLETQMLAPALAAQYPDFKTYSLLDVVTGVYRGQLFVSRFGLHALVFSETGTYFLRPVDRLNPTTHEVYFEEIETVNCFTDDLTDNFKEIKDEVESMMPANGATKRTYRIAIATTGEYYQQHGNTDSLVTAKIVSNVSDLTALYKRELATEFTLLTPLLFSDPATDPFVPDGSNNVPIYLQSAAVIGAHINVADYDIGHTIHYGGGGVAFLGVVCRNITLPDPDGADTVYTTGGYYKGAGWSGGSNSGLSFLTHFGHEVGHMFSAGHTFNGTGGNCTSNISSNSAWEIGSGSTILSYKGNCGAGQNIPGARDDYFLAKSLEQMLSYMNGLGNCAVTVASGNQPPMVTANPCGGSLTIPKLTPFTLTGSGSDPDGHVVYYTWEQTDEDGAGKPTQGFIGATAGNSPIAPLFRSYPPTTSPIRTFPELSFILNNANSADFEALPNVARTVNFRLQARDYQPFGAINNSDVAVMVSDTTGPLTVTAPNGGETWAAGSQTVTWNVNNTNTLSANVRILMSIDGGMTFPILLADNTPNDGSQTVDIPAVAGSTIARIKVECVVNACLTFFDISNANFTFTSPCAALLSVICPTAPLMFPSGDPGLNLSFKVQKPDLVTTKSYTITGADPTMNRVRWNVGRTLCEAPGGSAVNYQVLKFVVSQAGTYSFSFGSGNFRAVHIFANSFDPNGGCTNFVASSVEGNSFWSGIPGGAVLLPCTEYFLVVTNQFGGSNTTITFSGPGSIREEFVPQANYIYSYVAVNTATNLIAAVSASASFTSLGQGSYLIYGVHYKSSGAPPPPNVNPDSLLNKSVSALLNAGNCFLLSSTSMPLTVISSTTLVINEIDYDQPGTDNAEFIELKNISNAAVNLSGWTIELVNGDAGGAAVYQTIALPNVSLAAGDYFVVCGNNATVPNCDLVVSPATNLIQDGAPDAISLRENGALKDAVSYEGSAGTPYTESAGVTPGDTGAGAGRGISRFPDGNDTNNNSNDFISNTCITPGVVNGNATLTIGINVTNVACNGGSNGAIALAVLGGVSPYNYLWNNNQTTQTATGLVVGVYTATVTDTYGCTASASATVNQPAVLTVSKTITNVACNGGATGSVALTVSGGTSPYSYGWSNGQDKAAAINLAAGSYTATVTDANGCTSTTSATVTQPSALSISKTITNVACNGGTTGSVALTVSGGTSPYTYAWNNGQDSFIAINLAAGTYTATVTDANGCTATSSATVTQPSALSINKMITNVACNGSATGAVALTVSGGTSPYSYAWSNGQNTATAINLIAGTYTATVTDTKGCTASTSATVTQPTDLSILKNITHVTCHGGATGSVALTVSGGEMPYSYAWSNGQNTAMASNLAAGTYTVTVTDLNGCTTSTTALVTEAAVFAFGTVVTNESCLTGSDGSIVVSPTGGVAPYTYLWNNGQTTSTVINLVAGTYTVTATDATDCTGSTTANVNFGLPSESFVRAAPKVFLQGPYVSSVQLMHDSLRVQNRIPLLEPYTGLMNFTHTGGGGGEQTTAPVLAVSGPNAIVDWVFLELRSAVNPAQVVATRAALLQRDGDVVDVDGSSVVVFGVQADVSYFITVRHRNHLGVQLGATLAYPVCEDVETDFRVLPPEGFYAFNGLNPAQKLLSGKYLLWAGNGRVDYQLKYNGSNNDRTAILSVVGLATPNAIVSGYLLSDYNLDGVVKYNGSSNDRNVLLGNVGISTPSAILDDQVAR